MTTVVLDLSIVIPVKDEEKILAEPTSRVSNTIDKLGPELPKDVRYNFAYMPVEVDEREFGIISEREQ